MATSYQDVVRSNGTYASWAFTETTGLDFAPWIGGAHLTGHNAFLYQQAGPFAGAFALAANTTGYLTFSFPGGGVAPWTVEFWLKLGAYPPAATIKPAHGGNQTTPNGAGFYVLTSGVWHFQVIPVSDTTLTALTPDTNWHLIQFGHTDATGTTLQLAVDGQVRSTRTLVGMTAANPQSWGFLADAVGALPCTSALISYPAVYPSVFTAPQLLSTFIAATDPTSALALTRGAQQFVDNTTLQAILAAVRRTY
jgi:hypothetical protein